MPDSANIAAAEKKPQQTTFVLVTQFLRQTRDFEANFLRPVQTRSLRFPSFNSSIFKMDDYFKYDCRLSERLAVDRPGHIFIRGEAAGTPCQVVNIAASGARIETAKAFLPYAPLVLYAEGFGRFDCITVPGQGKLTGVMFIMGQDAMRAHMQKLSEIGATGDIPPTRLRRHPRTAAKGRGHFKDGKGRHTQCELVDVSQQGASLRTPMRPPVGEVIGFGNTLGRVVRHHADGVGIFFLSPYRDSAQGS